MGEEHSVILWRHKAHREAQAKTRKRKIDESNLKSEMDFDDEEPMEKQRRVVGFLRIFENFLFREEPLVESRFNHEKLRNQERKTMRQRTRKRGEKGNCLRR